MSEKWANINNSNRNIAAAVDDAVFVAVFDTLIGEIWDSLSPYSDDQINAIIDMSSIVSAGASSYFGA